MRITSPSQIVSELEMIERRPSPADAQGPVSYTRDDLPAFHSLRDSAHSTRHLGQRLIAQNAHTHGDVLVSIKTRPSHGEGVESVRQTRSSSDPVTPTLPPAGPTAAQTAVVLETVYDTLERLTEEQVSGAAPRSARDLRPQVSAVKAVLAGQLDLAQEFAAGTDAAPMIEHIVMELGANPQPPAEWAQSLLDFFSRVLSNQFEGGGGRWGANITNVVLRDLATVGTTTVLRQLAGMALESRFILEDLPPETRQLLGASMMLLGPCLNILGGLREEINHTATDKSRFARGTMLVLSLGVLVAAVASDRSDPVTQMASLGLQTTIYTISRDLIQLFMPLSDNTTSLSATSTAMAGLGYGANQVMASLLMDTLAPHSGASYPMSVAANAERTAESLMEMLLAQSVTNAGPTASTADVRATIYSAIEDLKPKLGHDLLRGLINTVAEIGDDILRPWIARHREVQSLIARTRAEAEAAGENPDEAQRSIPPQDLQGLRIYFDKLRVPIVGSGFPTREQFLNQMLTTSAMRTSIFQAVTGAILTAGTLLGNLGLSETQQQWAGYAVLASVMQIGYTPFLLAHDRSRDGNAGQMDTPAPAPTTGSQYASTYF